MGKEWAYSEAAEQAVIGSIMIDAEAYALASKHVGARDFYQERHGLIFEAVAELRAKGTAHDVVTLADFLAGRDELDRIGGVHYLGDLAANTPSSANVEAYAKIVGDKAARRKFRDVLSQAARQLANGSELNAVRAMLAQEAPGAPCVASERIVRGEELKLEPVAWQVKGVLSHGDTALLFGASNSLKSFVTIDLGLCIATGTEWHGHEVARGVVVFFVPEGQRGFPRRRRAWAISHHRDLSESLDYVSTLPADLTAVESIQALAGELERVRAQAGPISLLVFDTVAKNFGPGDENSTRDMSAFLAAAEGLARPHGSSVLFVHHTGHGDQARARGAYALKAGVDLEYRVTRQEGAMALTLECTKAKDFEPPEPMAFEARVVELGEADEYGQPLTSLALKRTNYQPPDQRGTGMGKNQSTALRVLRDLFEERRANLTKGGKPPEGARVAVDEWRTATNLPASRFREASEGLQARGLVEVQHGYVRLSE